MPTAKQRHACWAAAAAAFLAAAAGFAQTRPATAPAKKPTLAVLPFTTATADAKEKDLADRMRFAVSQKLSTDANAVEANGTFDRMDNVHVEQIASALEISFAPGKHPSDDEMQQLLATLDTDFVIAGTLQGRTVALTLFDHGKEAKQVTFQVPPDNESPKLAVEKALTDLTGTAFAHIRDQEVDHSDPKAEARFAAGPNLVPDADFSRAAQDPKAVAADWETLLGADHYAPPLLTAAGAADLPKDRAAIVPRSVAGDAADKGFCLLMRMSKAVAESNGLAVESTWIRVEQGKKYRFTAMYRSTGPVAHIFLKGFAEKPDQFGDKNDPEAARREFYRAQVLPRKKNDKWELIEMDFTPGTVKKSDPGIQWLRVDLYVYLTPGDIFFDDITVKKIGE